MSSAFQRGPAAASWRWAASWPWALQIALGFSKRVVVCRVTLKGIAKVIRYIVYDVEYVVDDIEYRVMVYGT